jgi:hypothetical protein
MQPEEGETESFSLTVRHVDGCTSTIRRPTCIAVLADISAAFDSLDGVSSIAADSTATNISANEWAPRTRFVSNTAIVLWHFHKAFGRRDGQRER